MKIKSVAGMALAGSLLSGCATIIDGTTQSVSVQTMPEQGAACTLTNSEGTWYLTSPGSVMVHKTKNDLSVTCTKAGFQPGNMVAPARFGGMTAGNILLGGVIGAGVDAASGANYAYDTPITVPLGATAAPQPQTLQPAPKPGA